MEDTDHSARARNATMIITPDQCQVSYISYFHTFLYHLTFIEWSTRHILDFTFLFYTITIRNLDYPGMADLVEPRIGGPDAYKVRPHSQPWMVRLALKWDTFCLSGHTCAGSLISFNHVLTAAHCVDGSHGVEWQQVVAIIGENNIKKKDGEKAMKIADCKIHKGWPRGMKKLIFIIQK